MRTKRKSYQLLDPEARGRLPRSVSGEGCQGWLSSLVEGSHTPDGPVLPGRPPGPPFSLIQAQSPPAHLLPIAPECLPCQGFI